MGPRWLTWAAIACLLTVACTQDVQGLRTPRSPASQSLGIKWQQGSETSYRWQLSGDYSQLGDSPARHTVAGDCDVAVGFVDSGDTALMQLTIRLDPQYVSANQTGVVVRNLQVGPRGRVTGNPDERFVELTWFFTLIPLLPPAGANPGDTWHETYRLPNPLYGDTRDFSVRGRFVRVEGSGLKRVVVIEAHMSASYNDSASYEDLYGPPPDGVPAHAEDRLTGSEVVDVTYRFDPVHQTLLNSIATARYDQRETLTDTTSGQAVAQPFPLVGTETMTITRS